MIEQPTTSRSTTVLIVEDHDLTQKVLANILDHAGYHVVAVSDSAEAIQAISEHCPDVIVCDLHLPHSNGLAVLRYAMSQPQPARVILLTGDTTTAPVVDALRAGAHDYLLKPCTPEALRQSVANALNQRLRDIQKRDLTEQLLRLTTTLEYIINTSTEQRPVAETHPPMIGQMIINPNENILHYKNSIVHLTPVEQRIIYKLAEAHGAVVSFSALVEYTHNQQVSSIKAQSLLKPHIWKIRQKTDKEFILTTWGIGYRLNTIMAGDANEFSVGDR